MSYARRFASLLNSSNLVEDSKIAGLTTSKLSGQITFSNMPSGSIIAVNIIRNGTRSSVSTAATQTLFSGSFTKLRSDSRLIARCTVFGAQYYSGNCGVGMNIDGGNWDFGTAYQYDGAWSNANQTTIITGQATWTGISAGSHTVGFGWNTVNNDAGNRPFNIFNPNSSDDGRNQQMVSSITIFEVAP